MAAITFLAATTTGAAVAQVPTSRGFVERPVGGHGVSMQPAFANDGGFFEGHASEGDDGRLWILDRQTGRVRSCLPPATAEAPPACSPWSQ
jgi:hypothetical protein